VDLGRLADAIEWGEVESAPALAQAAIDEGIAPQAILDVMTEAMRVVGGRFQRNEIYIPEMLVAALAMEGATARLEPHLVKDVFRYTSTAVIGTVRGDLHDIGKNLVGMMWKSAGIDVTDLGTSVEPEAFVAAVRKHKARLLGLSALLTTTMVEMREVVDAVRGAGLDTKILVGGAPVTAEYAKAIGADGYAPDAGSALDAARALIA
jgi:5-methyltetrahydrofolate--homocysteine methyltransferase